MEPRTHARGNPHASPAACASSTVLQWSHALTRVETIDGALRFRRGMYASMEPRTHARGNGSTRRDRYRNRQLQWSHALTRVETALRSRNIFPGDGASMEPRTHARGNTVPKCRGRTE